MNKAHKMNHLQLQVIQQWLKLKTAIETLLTSLYDKDIDEMWIISQIDEDILIQSPTEALHDLLNL